MIKALHILLLLFLLSMSGCVVSQKTNQDSQTKVTLPQVFSSVVENVILPTYQNIAQESARFVATTQSFCASSNAQTLLQAQQGWSRLTLLWKQSEAFQIGPAKKEEYQLTIGYWPFRERLMKKALGNSEAVNQEFVQYLAAASKGIYALEYLLFQAEKGKSVLETFQAENGVRRCQIVTNLALQVEAQTKKLYQEWASDDGNFSKELKTVGNSKVYPTSQVALNEMVNRWIHLLEKMQMTKMAKPMGLVYQGQARTQLVESPYSQQSKEQLIANVEGLQQIFMGGNVNQIGFDDYLLAINSPLAKEIPAQFQKTLLSLEEISLPLMSAITDSPQQVNRAYQEVKKLLILMKADLTMTLRITVDFSDNDGD